MDKRTKRQKVEAMANQSVSPHEAEVARAMLEDMPPDPPVRVPRTFTVVFTTGFPPNLDVEKVTFDEVVQNLVNEKMKEQMRVREEYLRKFHGLGKEVNMDGSG